MPIVVTHCTNVYGPRQHPEKFIPLVRRILKRGGTVQIHARNGESSTRCYIHVRDVCHAVELVLEKGGIIGSPTTGKYSISGKTEQKNSSVATAIAEHLGLSLRMESVEFVSNRPKHDQRYSVSDTELRLLGWEPQVSFSAGLATTLDWYEEHDP
jgi:dTDP-glucose 4,6-dehydratase